MQTQEDDDEDGSYKRVYPAGPPPFAFSVSSVPMNPAKSSVRDRCVLVAQSLGRRLAQSFPLAPAKSPSTADKKRPRKSAGSATPHATGLSPSALDPFSPDAERHGPAPPVPTVYCMGVLDVPTSGTSHWTGVGCLHTRKLDGAARVLALEDPSCAARKAVLREELALLQREADERTHRSGCVAK